MIDTCQDTALVASESSEDGTERGTQELDESGIGPAALGSTDSITLALYHYYVRGKKQRGQFVGLWPATILGLAVYLELDEVKQLLAASED